MKYEWKIKLENLKCKSDASHAPNIAHEPVKHRTVTSQLMECGVASI